MKKLSKKACLVVLILSIIVLFGIILSIALFANNIPCIGFYDIDDNIQKAFVNYFQKNMVNSNDKEIKYGIITYDNTLPLEPQIKKTPCHILFTNNSKQADNIAQKSKIKISDNILMGMPSTMQKASEGKYVPIIFDHFEVLSKEPIPMNLDSLISHAKARKAENLYPISFPGKDDKTLLLLVTAIIESRCGIEGLQVFQEALAETTDFETLLSTDLNQYYNFELILQHIVSWKKQGLLYPESLYLIEDDIISLIEADKTQIVFLPLSKHRLIPNTLLLNYESYFFPAGRKTVSRDLVAPAIVGIPLANKKFYENKSSLQVLQDLVDLDNQQKFAFATGLVPVNAKSKTADKQSSDARLWIASAVSATNDFATNTLASPDSIKTIVDEIRNYLSNN